MSLDHLTTEARNPAFADIDRLATIDLVRLMNGEDAAVAPAVGRCAEAIAQAIDLIGERLRDGGRLIYLGAGTSGRLGVLDASECPPTFNSPPWQVVGVIAGGPEALTRAVEGAEDHPEVAVADLQRLQASKRDVIVGIATSGRTPYVLGGLQLMREKGAATIGICCNDDSELSAVAQLMITPVVGPEIVSGSTRMKAGTATKLILNMLSTGAMIRLGKTYGDLMVDLRPTNQKLAERSRRILAVLTGAACDEVDLLLDASRGDLKTAIVMQRRSLTAVQARRALASTAGQLRRALDGAETGTLSPAGDEQQLSEYVLGVDGGGSTTRAWLSRRGTWTMEPVGVGEAGPSNALSAGWACATSNVDRAIESAFRAAGRKRGEVAAACLALAGAGRGVERQRWQAWAEQRLLAARIVVVTDADAVLAARPTPAVLAVISGTGSMAYGRTAEGRTARAGGLGGTLGDEGSAYDIALTGLRAASRSAEGRGPATDLVERFASALDATDLSAWPRILESWQADRAWIAELSRVVFSAAEAGDAVADGIVVRAATELSLLANCVTRALYPEGCPAKLAVNFAGGVLISQPLLRNRVIALLETSGWRPEPVALVPLPVAGAVRLARDAAQASL